MDLKNFLVLISAFINFFLCVFIFYKNKENKIIGRVYSFLALSVAYWAIGMFFYRMTTDIQSSIFWCKVLYSAPIFIVASFLYFTFIFPNYNKKYNIFLFFIISFSLIFVYLTLFSNSIIKNIVLNPGQEKEIIFGELYYIYIFFIVSFFVWGYVNLIKKIKTNSGIIKMQINYIFWGSFLSSFLGMITNLVMPTLGFFSLNWLGQVFSLIMSGFIIYAIITHRLMDIKLVARQYLVIGLSIFIVLAAFFLIDYYGQKKPFYISWTIFTFLFFFFLFYYQSFIKFLGKIFNKYFFTSLYDLKETIFDIIINFNSSLNYKKSFDFITERLIKTIHPTFIAIIKPDYKNIKYKVIYFTGEKKFTKKEIICNQSLENINHLLIKDEQETKTNFSVMQYLFKNYQIAILAPARSNGKNYAFLCFGEKESGDIYNKNDYYLIEIAASQIGNNLEMINYYKIIVKLNLKLNNEIKKRTNALLKANKKLRKLDDAKAEFIFVASHQLRAPLTAIKGYTAMLLDGDFGTIFPKEKEALMKIYESNERLIQFVDNLLNVSRIDSCKIQFIFTKTSLTPIVLSVVKQFSNLILEKGIILENKIEETPAANIDIDKIRSVIINLIDNALRYTEKGKIIISLIKIGNKVEFSVKDTGIGFDSSEKLLFFKKFSRGPRASLIYVEGIGLGLFVSQEIIKAHGAHIHAESGGPGRGARFYFRLNII